MAVLIGATVGTLRAALRDRRIVQKSHRNGTDLLLVRSDVRSESFRLVKHLLCYSGICAITPWGQRWLWSWGIDPAQFRNGILIAVAGLLGVNSLMDLWTRHHSPHAPKVLKAHEGKTV